MKSAIVTGLRGMDGSLLADQLIEKDYKVYGIIRRSSQGLDLGNASHLEWNKQLEVVEADLLDLPSLTRVQNLAKPNLFFNTAAQSHVGSSFDQPSYTFQVNTLGVLHCLEAIRLSGIHTRLNQCSSIEMDTPVLIQFKGEVRRISLREAFSLWSLSEDMKVYSCDKTGKAGFYKVKDVVSHGYKEVYEVGLYNGRTLRVTGDHSLITLNQGTQVETTIKELSPGDFLLTFCNREPFVEENQTLRWTTHLKRKSKKLIFGERITQFSFSLDEELAYLMGMYTAEGCVSTNKRGSRNTTFTFGKHEFDQLRPSQTISLLKKFFSANPVLKTRDSSVQVSVTRKYIGDFFESFCGVSSHSKRLCSALYLAPLNIRLAFLNGYLGDAHIFGQYNAISFTTVSRDLAIDLLWLLRLSGIAARMINRYINGHNSPQGTYIQGGTVFDIKISGSESWLSGSPGTSWKTPMARCLPKKGLGLRGRFSEKNPSRRKLRMVGHPLGFSDLGIEKIQYIRKSPVLQEVGDFAVEESEKWFCGEVPILVHNTSEMFGGVSNQPANEDTPFYPKSPYGVSKLAAYWIVRNYRESYKMFATNSICYNHEHYRRGPNFVTRKITLAAARIKLGLQEKLYLGNLDSKRDWGWAPDFTRGMIMILEDASQPRDYVMATGETHSVREFCCAAFSALGLDWTQYVEIDPRFFRPAEVDVLIGDYSRIKSDLGWQPSITFTKLVEEMTLHDFNHLQEGVA